MSIAAAPLSLGIDIGGTFTDLVIHDPRDGRAVIWKESTTPDDPARGAIEGTRRVLAVLTVGEEPGFIAITPDSQYALVLNHRSGDLAVIRIAAISQRRNEAERRSRTAPLFTLIPVGSGPVSAAVRRV